MRLEISLADQEASLFDLHGNCIRRYPVSTSANGPGEEKNSYCTPRGQHIVRAKIGTGAALGSAFVGRRPTGEVCSASLHLAASDRDWILTRILWLSGTEIGVNRRGRCDTMQRYIYIHGAPDGTRLGVPQSHGCIRMSNKDVAELFELLPCYSPINISEH